MVDDQAIIETGRRVRSRTEAMVRRAQQLVDASHQLIQQAKLEEEATVELLGTLFEVRGFIQENRRDLHHSLKRE